MGFSTSSLIIFGYHGHHQSGVYWTDACHSCVAGTFVHISQTDSVDGESPCKTERSLLESPSKMGRARITAHLQPHPLALLNFAKPMSFPVLASIAIIKLQSTLLLWTNQ